MTQIINHHSKAETISNLTVNSQLFQNNFTSAKNIYSVKDEVRAGCPKIGHANLYTSGTR